MQEPQKKGSRAIWLIGLGFKIFFFLVVVITPLMGVWVASSITAYLNGPVWLACLAGLFLFPILPVTWDLFGTYRFRRKVARARSEQKDEPTRFLTAFDRLILRTLTINIFFLGVLVFSTPQVGFAALSTRGDWMLTYFEETRQVEPYRKVLFTAAGALEWLYEATLDNPFEAYEDEKTVVPQRSEIDDRTKDDVDLVELLLDDDAPDSKPEDRKGDKEHDKKPGKVTPDPTIDRKAGEPPRWPVVAKLHPLVTSIPSSEEKSIESVARYIGEREKDPFLRVKAMHDWIADRIAYDAPALARGEYPPQDAETVFRTRLAVCAGYARLLIEMGKITGDEIVYVSGVSRDFHGNVSGVGHAWNAALIENRWYLIDVTWNAGSVENDTFKKRYSTAYLFTPPAIFISDHYPNDEAWQLLSEPVSRADFMRQPILRPEFYQNGLRLVEPTRSQISVRERAVVRIANPARRRVLGHLGPRQGGNAEQCIVEGSGGSSSFHVAKAAREIPRPANKDETVVVCEVPRSGEYSLLLFAGPSEATSFPMVGTIQVHR